MSVQSPWIIFDADNTLWDVESLYDDARDMFCRYVKESVDKDASKAITVDLLSQAQQHRDIQLKNTYGYSASRFARSFEDTLNFFFPFATPDQIIHIRRLALDVFDRPGKPVAELEATLEKLADIYKLAIITAGERWVQEKRLQEFHLRKMFTKLLVVERKTPDVFITFCADHQIDPRTSWVVGDSVMSDIRPAHEAGLNAIHVQVNNWIPENGQLPDGIMSVRKLPDILPVLLPT